MEVKKLEEKLKVFVENKDKNKDQELWSDYIDYLFFGENVEL